MTADAGSVDDCDKSSLSPHSGSLGHERDNHLLVPGTAQRAGESLTVSPGHAPAFSPWASSIRVHSRAASLAFPLCSSCAMLVCSFYVLLWLASLCLP